MKTLRNFLLLLAATLFIASCDEREFDTPPLTIPEYNGQANMTIQDLKTKYAGQSLVLIEEPIIIQGLVVANDISGNIYKQIQLQDETGGITIAIDRNSIFANYRVGQEVFIECEGMYFGLYGGTPQLGYQYVNSSNQLAIGQAPWLFFQSKAFPNRLPQPNLVVAKGFDGIENVTAADVGRLITIQNVMFENAGKPFSPAPASGVATVSENLVSATNPNSKLVARNSSAADFASKPMPTGVGSVTGVLSVFNGTLQITFRTYDDCSQDRFGAEGNGTQAAPWSIDFALAHQTSDATGWIQGYIVGAVKPGINTTTPITSSNDINFESQFFNQTVVLAASPDERDWTKCVVVDLASNPTIQSQVNLMDNPGNLGKELKISGKLENFLGAAGLTNITAFELEGETVLPGANLIFNETFGLPVQTGTSWPSVADFAAANGFVTTGAGAGAVTYSTEVGLVSIRSNQASSGYTGATGGGNAMAAATGASLIVNDIATCGATSLVLSFGSNVTSATIPVSYRINDTDNWVNIPYDKTTEAWGLTTVAFNLPAGTNTINLKFAAGAYTYGSRVDDISITTDDTLGTPIIDPDSGGGGGGGETGGTQDSPYDIATARANQDNSVKWIQGYIVGCVKSGVSTIASANDVWIGVTSGWDLNTNVLLADNPNETDYTKCVVVNLPAGSALRTQVNLMDNPSNFQKQLSVTGTLRTYFGIAGLRDAPGTATDFTLQ